MEVRILFDIKDTAYWLSEVRMKLYEAEDGFKIFLKIIVEVSKYLGGEMKEGIVRKTRALYTPRNKVYEDYLEVSIHYRNTAA